MMRKLASIQQVVDITPIEGADKIEAATVLGWQCVVKKGELEPGDPVVFFEIDSVLPEAEWCAFLGEHRRIKTRKFRGQISQGLALPLSDFPDYDGMPTGTDLSGALGIIKYEIPKRFKVGDNAGAFPSHLGISKTDEVRIQSEPGLLDEMAGFAYIVTEKIDGTSCTIVFADKLIVASRNWAKKRGENVYWRIVDKYDLERLTGKGFAIQGEIYGPGIQKNTYGAEQLSFAVFDVFDLAKGEYVPAGELPLYSGDYGFPLVNMIVKGERFDMTIKELEVLSEGCYPNGHQREGIVVRQLHWASQSDILGRRLSFKCVNKKYLLKGD